MVTGVTGLLGRYLLQSIPDGFLVQGVARNRIPDTETKVNELDLNDRNQVNDFFEAERFDVIVHAAAEGRVDAVEGSKNKFRPLNVHVPEYLAALARERKAHFVFLSSNAVFGGRAEPYGDFDDLTPINDYGVLKLEAEQAVVTANVDAAIVRPILMYGWPYSTGRTNLAQQIVENLKIGKPFRALTDVFTEPLYAMDAADVVWKVVTNGFKGPLNVSGGTRLSIYDFALMVARVFDLDSNLIEPVTFSEIGGLSRRPVETRFSLERLRSELHHEPMSPEKGLSQMRDEGRDGQRP